MSQTGNSAMKLLPIFMMALWYPALNVDADGATDA